MKSGTVPDHRGVDIGCQRTGELVQKLIDDRRVQARREDPFGLAGLRARRSDDPEVFVLGLPHHRRPRAALGSHASQRPLLAEAALILKEDDDSMVGVLGLDPCELFGNFFLKAATASGSDLRCFGRGTSHSSFKPWSRSYTAERDVSVRRNTYFLSWSPDPVSELHETGSGARR